MPDAPHHGRSHATAGIDEEYLEQYGRYKAKIDHRLLDIGPTDLTAS